MFSSGVHHAWASSVNFRIYVTDYEKLRYRPYQAAVKKNLGIRQITIERGIVCRREFVYVSGNVDTREAARSGCPKEISYEPTRSCSQTAIAGS